MTAAQIVLIILAIHALGAAALCWFAERSPIGYEDDSGYHDGEK